jgi:nucleoside-diphosphate-sugar epimerase
VARCLIVGCGCRGQALTRALRGDGHAVRGTTRVPERSAAIEAAGAESYVGDPDRVGTLFGALAHVGVACVLLGSAIGTDEQLAALHSTRLDMLLEKMLDTTVRAVVYEAAGTVHPELLAVGAGRVRYWCERSLIPYVLLEHDPSDHAGWTAVAVDAVERGLMSGGRPGP